MGVLAKYREVQPISIPGFDEDASAHACVTQGDEALTLRTEEHGTQKL